ncbi:phosphohistidine phosphatase [Rhizobium sp. Root274]|nr:phosphohistidine phosphatase [Rhizobium sp. Root1240]KRD33830.1 phosphohistidine phosphatase [Rhizobium sp. Root274]
MSSAAAAAFASRAGAATDPWAAFRLGQALVLVRHASAPGIGDPPGFRLGACDTQRNLSDAGRAQARRMGDLFRANGVTAARVYSSQWCRCLDTAEGLALGPVAEQPLLNSFFGTPEDGSEQTMKLSAWLAGLSGPVPVILVTHQVNITGLADIVPQSGELVFVTLDPAGAATVLGRQQTA